jgi:hypothetical protein
MSAENVESLRAFWETWNPGEAPDMSLLDLNGSSRPFGQDRCLPPQSPLERR